MTSAMRSRGIRVFSKVRVVLGGDRLVDDLSRLVEGPGHTTFNGGDINGREAKIQFTHGPRR